MPALDYTAGNISIHALRKECDSICLHWIILLAIFLSTHSVRSATFVTNEPDSRNTAFLSTHSVRSATIVHPQYNRIFAISIHALRKECDFRPDYSTNADGDISIHALRKECDGLL